MEISEKALEKYSIEIREAIEIARKLICKESISPNDGGLLEYIGQYLADCGFTIERIDINETKNLYAKINPSSDHFNEDRVYFCFAGHVDVVPPGKGWKHSNPYSGIIEKGQISKMISDSNVDDKNENNSENYFYGRDCCQKNYNQHDNANECSLENNEMDYCLYGRGSNDMKTTIACAMVAFKNALIENPDLPLAFLLTSDEEASAQDGIKKVVPILKERGEKFSMFILGEPSCDKIIGDIVKIGRRGSITAVARVFGQQGHIAYPQHANNPITKVIKIAKELIEIDFEDEDSVFGKSRLEITNINAFNEATNVIPGVAEIRFGTRFNPKQSEDSIRSKVEKIFAKHAVKYQIDWIFHGNAFICKDEKKLEWLAQNIKAITHKLPIFDGKGATSDGRFLCQLGPSIEIGFQENMAHQVDERVLIDDVEKIYRIYERLVQNLAFLN